MDIAEEMRICKMEEIYLKFPAILKKKLEDKEISFPDATLFDYEQLQGYRAVERKTEDNTAPNKKDFRSHAERKLRVQNKNTAEYYGVSFFMKPEIVENILHVSTNPKKKMMQGYVYKEGGPCLINESTQHICWWLYEDADISGFKLI